MIRIVDNYLAKSGLKSIRLIESIHGKGVFGSCSCAGEVLYYTDRGVRCSTCGKVYGVWGNNGRVLIKRANQNYLQASKLEFDSEYPGDKFMDFKVHEPLAPEISLDKTILPRDYYNNW